MVNNADKDRIFVSHITLRRVVGVLGVALPAIVVLWGFALCNCTVLRESISDYYHTGTRDAFVGILFVIAWFLFAYKGYEDKDDLFGDLACVFALGVALFPSGEGTWQGKVHFVSATGLFLVLSYFALVLFRKTGGSPTPQKEHRNTVYLACGAVMLACIALIGIFYWLLENTSIATLKPVFWLESAALWAFGISWFVKGDTLLRDPV